MGASDKRACLDVMRGWGAVGVTCGLALLQLKQAPAKWWLTIPRFVVCDWCKEKEAIYMHGFAALDFQVDALRFSKALPATAISLDRSDPHQAHTSSECRCCDALILCFVVWLLVREAGFDPIRCNTKQSPAKNRLVGRL